MVREYGSLGCSGDLAPLSHCALALMGEGEVRDADGDADAGGRRARRRRPRAGRAQGQGGPGPHQRHRRHARHAGAGDHRPADAAAHRRHRRRDERRGADGHRPGLRRRAAGAPAPGGTRALGRQPARRARRLGRSWPATATTSSTGCRTPTRCAARRRCTAPPATPSSTPRPSPVASWPPRSTTRWSSDDRVESNGNFHGAPVGVRARLPGDRRRRHGLDQRAAHRPVPRPRPATTTCRRSWPTTPASTAAT